MLSSLVAIEYILETKVLLGCITLVACWIVPINDGICLFLAFFWKAMFSTILGF